MLVIQHRIPAIRKDLASHKFAKLPDMSLQASLQHYMRTGPYDSEGKIDSYHNKAHLVNFIWPL